MKVVVDEVKCEGHGRCYALAPDLFEPMDDLGHSQVLGAGELADEPDILARVTRVADACPERAIIIQTPGDPQ